MTQWDYGRLASFAECLERAAHTMALELECHSQEDYDLSRVNRLSRQCEREMRSIKALLRAERRNKA